jgi:hypothetical protein
MDNIVATGGLRTLAEGDTLDSETWSGVFEYYGVVDGKRILFETIRIEFR